MIAKIMSATALVRRASGIKTTVAEPRPVAIERYEKGLSMP
jgi:hypothetical protein